MNPFRGHMGMLLFQEGLIDLLRTNSLILHDPVINL
jgi:hypothetical protein